MAIEPTLTLPDELISLNVNQFDFESFSPHARFLNQGNGCRLAFNGNFFFASIVTFYFYGSVSSSNRFGGFSSRNNRSDYVGIELYNIIGLPDVFCYRIAQIE